MRKSKCNLPSSCNEAGRSARLYCVPYLHSDFLCAQLTNGYHFTFPVNPSMLAITLSDKRTSQIQNNVFLHIKHQIAPSKGYQPSLAWWTIEHFDVPCISETFLQLYHQKTWLVASKSYSFAASYPISRPLSTTVLSRSTLPGSCEDYVNSEAILRQN